MFIHSFIHLFGAKHSLHVQFDIFPASTEIWILKAPNARWQVLLLLLFRPSVLVHVRATAGC